MSRKIDEGIIDKTKTCIVAKKCLENFDSTLCCDIVEKCSTFLIVEPTSSFKSPNCSYCQAINNNGSQAYICSCPLRLELYIKYGE